MLYEVITVDVGAGGEQALHGLDIAELRGSQQRRAAEAVPGVDGGAMRQQKLNGLRMAVFGRTHQCRLPAAARGKALLRVDVGTLLDESEHRRRLSGGSSVAESAGPGVRITSYNVCYTKLLRGT